MKNRNYKALYKDNHAANGKSEEWHRIKSIPKAELHLHLEGAASYKAYKRIGRRNNKSVEFICKRAVNKPPVFHNFDDFGSHYIELVELIKKPADLADLFKDVVTRLVDDNTVYAEITWTPQLHIHKFGEFEDWLNALNQVRHQAEQYHGIQIRWVLDILRDRGVSEADKVVEWVTSDASRNGGVVGLGLGGTEEEYPTKDFEKVFLKARYLLDKSKACMGFVPHAGEHQGKISGSQSVLHAIEKLCANRIGHGNRAIEDPLVVEKLRDGKIPLELCPTSNVLLGAYKNYEAHPLRRLVEAGCVVTVNTDDPNIFHINLCDELMIALNLLGGDFDILEKIIDNAFKVALDPEAASSARKLAGKVQRIASVSRAALAPSNKHKNDFLLV